MWFTPPIEPFLRRPGIVMWFSRKHALLTNGSDPDSYSYCRQLTRNEWELEKGGILEKGPWPAVDPEDLVPTMHQLYLARNRNINGPKPTLPSRAPCRRVVELLKPKKILHSEPLVKWAHAIPSRKHICFQGSTYAHELLMSFSKGRLNIIWPFTIGTTPAK